jgi:hypothetical protein
MGSQHGALDWAYFSFGGRILVLAAHVSGDGGGKF